MKRNDNGDFCVLYVEPGDERATLLQIVKEQVKPVVIMLAEQARIFLRPEDFTVLKHIKRQLDLPIVFVVPSSSRLAHMATRNGFSVYRSMEGLADALMSGHFARYRALSRTPDQPEGNTSAITELPPPSPPDEAGFTRTGPLQGTTPAPSLTPRRTAPLYSTSPTPPLTPRRTVPLRSTASSPPLPLGGTVPLQNPQGENEKMYYEPASALPFLATQEIPLPARPDQPSRFLKIVLIMAILAVTIAGAGSFFVFSQNLPGMSRSANVQPPVTPAIIGRVSFLSSEQLSENSNQGISDQVLIDLHFLKQPAPQKKYYAWLLSDKKQADTRSLLLGALQVNDGSAHMMYGGDNQHTNLLASFSRLLVTEEDATMTPVSPTPDYRAWRYYGEFSQVPLNLPGDPNHFSYLDHLRHLLATDPTLDALELPGGLNNWLYRNTGQLLTLTTGMRQPWEDTRNAAVLRSQVVHILEYLDGFSFVQQDMPANIPVQNADRLARLGLLSVNGPNQEPPGYLTHVLNHISGLLQTPGATSAIRTTASGIVVAIDGINAWLTRVRQDAQRLVKMSDAQLGSYGTLTIINDMIDNAQNAYVGQQDPTTGKVRQGVNWIHDQMQQLATMGIAPYTGGDQSIQMINGQSQGATA